MSNEPPPIIIYADPPWPFRVWSKDTGSGRSAESHYPTMTIEQLCALPVKDLAGKNSALFLWAVWPSIFEYIPWLAEAWGYTYKTLAWEWVKLNTSGRGWAVGMGYYTRANTEPCLLLTRGRMPVAVRDELGLIVSYTEDFFTPESELGLPMVYPRYAHSQKPPEAYRKIERLYPDGVYLELFARRKHPGWLSWGNEIESDFVLQAGG